MVYNYLVSVYDDKKRIMSVIFSYRDEALYFAEKNRKCGLTVIITPVECKLQNLKTLEKEKKNDYY